MRLITSRSKLKQYLHTLDKEKSAWWLIVIGGRYPVLILCH